MEYTKMTDEELPVLLLTCSGISHTGQLTTMTGNLLRCRNPLMVTRHLKLTSLERSLEKELDTDEYLVAVDGCEECCAKKRMDLLGKIPDTYVVATREGIEKRGLEEPRYNEIECLCQAVARAVMREYDEASVRR
ncbi:MAG TPA: putative zinc-binding protein [Methanoregulaceae archaeon]|jgi:uncharacterized metal-binding protein|nr:hypothetical protein [Methanolinea sp.]MDD5048653.1 putative zinc-binding protein [Methanoregulaceae archaeon]HQA80284.1 putative zinc-binding protein [Methanoregulaceae archaeon]